MDTALYHESHTPENRSHPTTSPVDSTAEVITEANDVARENHIRDGSPDAPPVAGPLLTADGRYRISSFAREEHLLRALRVEQIHGESYVAAGYVQPSALDELGRLDNSIPEFVMDKVRGSTDLIDVRYLYATPCCSRPGQRDEAGLRVANVRAAGSLDDLAAFSACKISLGRMYKHELYDTFDALGPGGIKEITSLSATTDAHCSAPYALIREALHQGLTSRTAEKWLITFALPAFHKMRKRMGEIVIHPAGEPFYAHRNEDPRTSNDLLLVPSIIDTKDFIENIARSIALADSHRTACIRFDTLAFMARGLDEELLMPLTRRMLRGGI